MKKKLQRKTIYRFQKALVQKMFIRNFIFKYRLRMNLSVHVHLYLRISNVYVSKEFLKFEIEVWCLMKLWCFALQHTVILL